MRRKTGANPWDYIKAALMLAGTTGTLAAKAAPADNWNVEGNHGQLYVHGVLNEGACNLDMASAFQEIDMGALAISQLAYPGARGRPVPFTLQLKACPRARSDSLDIRTGTDSRDTLQPVATARFLAPTRADNSELINVVGVQGLALQITDSRGRSTHPGSSSAPQFVMPGRDRFTWYITPVRTALPVSPGGWHAVVNFALSYD